VRRADLHPDAAGVEYGECILQPHPELADYARIAAFLSALVLGQMLVAQAPAKVADMPAPVCVLGDDRVLDLGQDLLIERVSDDLTNSEQHRPVVQDPLDVQVETLLAGAQLASRSISHCAHPTVVPHRANMSGVDNLVAPARR